MDSTFQEYEFTMQSMKTVECWNLPKDRSKIAVHTSNIPELIPPSYMGTFNFGKRTAHLSFENLTLDVIEATRRILATSITVPDNAG